MSSEQAADGATGSPGSGRGLHDGWAERLEASAFLTLYVTGFWGQAGRLLPAPFDDWYGVPYRLIAPWWHGHVLPGLARVEQTALFQVLEGWLLALLVPLAALRVLGISARDAGLAPPRRLGWPVTAAGVLVSLPTGLWLATASADPWGTPLQEALEFLIIPPEHFLLFGVFGVMLLPGRRLDWRAGEAGVAVRVFALLVAACVFGLVHVGTPHPAELLASFPLGLLFAAMTFATGSVWPAVAAHVALNVFPMAFLPWPA